MSDVSRRGCLICLPGLTLGLALVLPVPAQDAAPPTPDTDALADQAAGTPDFLAQKIANRYGLNEWDQIQKLTFTFNVAAANRKEPMARSWEWDIAGDTVTRTVNGESHQFKLSLTEQKVSSHSEDYKAHPQFINDSYWLLFPFQLVWSDPVVTVSEMPQLMPIGDATAYRYTAQWPAAGGYTPGDAYDLYVDADTGLIQQWAFRKGGSPDNPRPATWDDHQRLGPILVSLDHHGPPESGFRLWFTEVTATLADGSTVTPQPMDGE